jgi:ribose transport system substrate-binding protein
VSKLVWRVKMTRKRIAIGLLALALTTSCARTGRKMIGVIPKGSSHVFWQTVHAGAIKAARETGYEILWNAPAVEGDRSRQIAIVESMINQQVAGIALAPSDRSALSAVVERAVAGGIPVMIFDSGIDTLKRLGYVGTDNKSGGRVAARRLGEALGGKGLVVVVTDAPGSASTSERDAGFIEEVHAKFPGIHLLETQYCDTSRAKARSIVENLLTAHEDLAGVFADHENATVGAALALKSRQRRSVKLVGFDASEELVDNVKAGWIDALVVQNPFEMGYQAVRSIVTKLQGGSPAAETDTGVTLVRAADLDSPQIRNVLFPDIQQYLTGSR